MMWGFLLIIHEILLMLTKYDSQVSNVELLASEMWGRLEIHPAVRYDFFVNNEFCCSRLDFFTAWWAPRTDQI